uniref:Ataxin-7-like protein 1 n=1 Tax=Chelonoidis abingdonii TaxID=106734 RepID=A0A8C0FYY1_CHEAB
DDVRRSRIPWLGQGRSRSGAMAALERPVPSPEAFLGQPWAAWVREAAPPHAHCVDLEETGKEGRKSREVMRLNKEDMHLFGHYPAHDDFYLVVCNICNQVVKPQVFQSHCGKTQKKRSQGFIFRKVDLLQVACIQQKL